MCKHILVNNFKQDDLNLLHEFCLKTHEHDGFGAILRTKAGKIEVIKSLNLGAFYMRLTLRLVENDIRTVVVHHRTSTNGDGLEYAHPFKYRGHYLTHNGVVSVPGVHAVKTTNDSEALLHHLVKTGFDTGLISGYFSCFILKKKKTTVLVDATAPMYTDGRVYSSHNMGDGFNKIELKRIQLNSVGLVIASLDIKVSASRFGLDKAHLSLGSWHDTPLQTSDYSSYSQFENPEVEFFVNALSADEDDALFSCRSKDDLKLLIDQIAWSNGQNLTENEMDSLVLYFSVQSESA